MCVVIRIVWLQFCAADVLNVDELFLSWILTADLYETHNEIYETHNENDSSRKKKNAGNIKLFGMW